MFLPLKLAFSELLKLLQNAMPFLAPISWLFAVIANITNAVNKASSMSKIFL